MGLLLWNNFLPHLVGRSLLGILAELTELLRSADLKKNTESHFHGILVVITYKLFCKDTPVSIAVFGVGTDIKTHLDM